MLATTQGWNAFTTAGFIMGNQGIIDCLDMRAISTCYDHFVMYNVRNLASAFNFGILAALTSDTDTNF